MPTAIITTDDLREFKHEVIEAIQKVLQSNSGIQQKKYLKSSELMELLQVSPGTLQTLRLNGTLPYTKIGGIIYYDGDEIQQVMNNNKINNN